MQGAFAPTQTQQALTYEPPGRHGCSSPDSTWNSLPSEGTQRGSAPGSFPGGGCSAWGHGAGSSLCWLPRFPRTRPASLPPTFRDPRRSLFSVLTGLLPASSKCWFLDSTSQLGFYCGGFQDLGVQSDTCAMRAMQSRASPELLQMCLQAPGAGLVQPRRPLSPSAAPVVRQQRLVSTGHRSGSSRGTPGQHRGQ